MMLKDNLLEGIKMFLPLPEMEDSPVDQFLQGLVDHLHIGMECHSVQVLVYLRVDWAELRDLFCFLRKKTAGLTGQDSGLHLLVQIKSMLSAKDLVAHIEVLKEFLLQNASNPRTNLSLSLKARMSVALMQMLQEQAKP